jgi:hypothetical protein
MELVSHLQNITNLIAAYKVQNDTFQLSTKITKTSTSTQEFSQNNTNLALEFVHTIEAIFFYNFIQKPDKLWDFIKTISHPSLIHSVENEFSQIRTNVGKSRLWIHLVINDRSITSYISSLATVSKVTSRFSRFPSFSRLSQFSDNKPDHSQAFHSQETRTLLQTSLYGCLESFNDESISFTTNSALLNDLSECSRTHQLINSRFVESRLVLGTIAKNLAHLEYAANQQKMADSALNQEHKYTTNERYTQSYTHQVKHIQVEKSYSANGQSVKGSLCFGTRIKFKNVPNSSHQLAILQHLNSNSTQSSSINASKSNNSGTSKSSENYPLLATRIPGIYDDHVKKYTIQNKHFHRIRSMSVSSDRLTYSDLESASPTQLLSDHTFYISPSNHKIKVKRVHVNTFQIKIVDSGFSSDYSETSNKNSDKNSNKNAQFREVSRSMIPVNTEKPQPPENTNSSDTPNLNFYRISYLHHTKPVNALESPPESPEPLNQKEYASKPYKKLEFDEILSEDGNLNEDLAETSSEKGLNLDFSGDYFNEFQSNEFNMSNEFQSNEFHPDEFHSNSYPTIDLDESNQAEDDATTTNFETPDRYNKRPSSNDGKNDKSNEMMTEGFVWKRRDWLKAWAPRFLILHNDRLSYYKNNNISKCAGRFLLSDIKQVYENTFPGQKYVFTVVLKDSYTIHLACRTAAEALAWVRTITNYQKNPMLISVLDPKNKVEKSAEKNEDDSHVFGSDGDNREFSDTNSTFLFKNELLEECWNPVSTKISKNITLADQNFQCAQCRVDLEPVGISNNSILMNSAGSIFDDSTTDSSVSSQQTSPAYHSMISKLSNPKLCNYTNYYFCEMCMHDSPMLIPEKILKNWNWTPHQVSFVAFRYLEEAYRNSEPLDVSKSPDLYSILPNLLSTQKAKEKLLQIVNFTDPCRLADTRQAYFAKLANFVNLYTITELQNLPKLQKNFEKLFKNLKEHVCKCPICCGRGFVCEFCRDSQVIYVFSENVECCDSCGMLGHDFCWLDRNEAGGDCPKCERLMKRRKNNFVGGLKQSHVQQE